MIIFHLRRKKKNRLLLDEEDDSQRTTDTKNNADSTRFSEHLDQTLLLGILQALPLSSREFILNIDGLFAQLALITYLQSESAKVKLQKERRHAKKHHRGMEKTIVEITKQIKAKLITALKKKIKAIKSKRNSKQSKRHQKHLLNGHKFGSKLRKALAKKKAKGKKPYKVKKKAKAKSPLKKANLKKSNLKKAKRKAAAIKRQKARLKALRKIKALIKKAKTGTSKKSKTRITKSKGGKTIKFAKTAKLYTHVRPSDKAMSKATAKLAKKARQKEKARLSARKHQAKENETRSIFAQKGKARSVVSTSKLIKAKQAKSAFFTPKKVIPHAGPPSQSHQDSKESRPLQSSQK